LFILVVSYIHEFRISKSLVILLGSRIIRIYARLLTDFNGGLYVIEYYPRADYLFHYLSKYVSIDRDPLMLSVNITIFRQSDLILMKMSKTYH